MTADATLTGWLDAARAGGFPMPARTDRWQVLRAGVVNLWEFERAEYWHANGWAQLTGRNETGKSTLMALTTLIPWLADTGPGNIDTLGRGGKRFRYYVEPTTADGDRRDASKAANRGWLWVEYGRLIDGEPRFFTTLLFAEARSASGSLDLRWCTLEGGARVRADVDLAPHRMVAAPKEIGMAGFRVHATATEHRAHVARHLLGSTTDRLEAVGKMLKVTRTPKLGAQLQVSFVQDHLRDALPELSRTEVDALATGWDQLDQIRADLAMTSDAMTAIDRFRKTAWIPWVESVVRQRADAAASARTEFDRVTRDETEARDTLATCQGNETSLTTQVRAQRVAAEAARAAADALQTSARYQDAQTRLEKLKSFQNTRDNLASQLAEREADLARARERAAASVAEVDAAEARVAEAHLARDEALDAFATAGAAVHIAVPATGLDADAASQELRDRATAVTRAEQFRDEYVAADHAADLAETTADADANRAAQDRQRADAAWADANTARDSLAHALAVWSDGVAPAIDATLVDAWIDGLPTTAGEAGPRLTDGVRAQWFEPARATWDAAVAQAARELEAARAEIRRCTADIETLRTTPVPRFAEPVAWARRDRPPSSGDGAPLWALLDPRPGVTSGVLARIEAALAATGLLDAWVTPDGVFAPDRDGDDVLVAPLAPVAGPSLADVLCVADPESALAATAAGVLSGVSLELSDADVAVAPDGRWRLPGLTGRARPVHDVAEWIGETARADQRRRRIVELTKEKADWQAHADAADADRVAAEHGRAKLTAEFERCPDDAALRRALTLAQERDGVATRSQSDADRSRADAAARRSTADSAAAALHTFCAQRQLPANASGLRQYRDDVETASGRLAHYRHADAKATDAAAAAARAGARHEAADAEVATHLSRRETTAAHLADAAATVAAIAATIGADDQAVLEELTRLQQEERTAAQARDELFDQLSSVREEVGRAKAALATTQQRREEATSRRDEAFRQFRHLVDVGLTSEIGLDLPSAEAAVGGRVRDQVAETRRRVTPRSWPEQPDEQETFVRRRDGALSDLAQDARTRLEAGGRTLRIIRTDDGLLRVEIVADASGAALSPREAEVRLSQINAELEETYNQRVRATLDELLGSTFLEHLRERLGDARELIRHINEVLAAHPVVTTQTSLRITLASKTSDDERMLNAIGGPSLADPEIADRIRANLRQRVENAKQTALSEGEADWRDRLAEQLDYRHWLDVQLERKIGRDGRWAPLTTQAFAELSGGARAVMLMLPLVSTLAALYQEMDGAPRPLWLDEAFDGLDASNRAMIMGLFQRFDLDVLLAGPTRLVNVATVPAAAIYQVVRAPAPTPGVDLLLELWAGGELITVDLPVAAPSPEQADGPSEGMLV